MAKPKKLTFGKVMTKKNKEGKINTFIALGQRNPKAPQYDLSVEIVVRGPNGDVLARQTDGFLEVVNPRTKHTELLALNLITEEQAAKMAERASKIPDAIRHELVIKT